MKPKKLDSFITLFWLMLSDIRLVCWPAMWPNVNALKSYRSLHLSCVTALNQCFVFAVLKCDWDKVKYAVEILAMGKLDEHGGYLSTIACKFLLLISSIC